MNSKNRIDQIRKKLFRAYEGRAAILKALAHPARLIMLETMQETGEICVQDLVEMIGSDQSTVSKHLNLLKHTGLVKDRKEGRRIYYRVTHPSVVDLLDYVERVVEGRVEAGRH